MSEPYASSHDSFAPSPPSGPPTSPLRTIERIGPVSLAKIMAALYGLSALLLGGLFGVIFLIAALAGEQEVGVGEALVLIFALPVLYTLVGVLLGLLTGWLYNTVARFLGGLEVELR